MHVFVLFFRTQYPALGLGGERFSRPPSKRSRDSSPYVKDSFTHKFCLLDRTDASRTPTAADQIELNGAGLGCEKITISSRNADHNLFLQNLENTYPKLKPQNGAIELLKAEGGGCGRRLIVVPPKKDGYSVLYLKKTFSANSTIYIRPLQSDLSLYIEAGSSSHIDVKCMYCDNDYPLNEIRDHQSHCQNQESTSSASLEEVASDKGHIDLTSEDEEEKQNILKSMFPNVPEREVRNVLRLSFSIDEAANALSDRADIVSTAVSKVSCDNTGENYASLAELLESFRGKVKGGKKDSIELEVDRLNLWMDALRFYKKNISDYGFMTKSFYITFKGEDGVDGGALKQEFFTLLLTEIVKRIFEGQDNNMFLLKDISKCTLFKVAGMIIVHSLLEGCPDGLPIMAEHALFYQICRKEESVVLSSLFRELIPLNASTEILLELINKLDECASNDDVTKLLYGNDYKCDVYWAVINSIHWPSTVNITHDKCALHHELVMSRKNETDVLIYGLKSCGFYQYMLSFPDLVRPLFCHSHKRCHD